ncbi:MAG: GH116 family glycosyl hydrolase, partial [Actinocatenispora sp.]
QDYGHSRFWLGNEYATRFVDAVDVAETVQRDWYELRAATREWTDTLAASSLPAEVTERMAGLASTVRSPSMFRTAEGRVLGFEGVQGASTAMWAGVHGGSCPLNCTHVWNYEQTLARLYPTLELDMRDIEFDVLQAPEGYVPHRLRAPLYLKQLWDTHIGGPDTPALDGMLGVVLKSYREVRAGAGLPWLLRRWPNLRRLMAHVRSTWDPDGTGVLRGIQPSTHDIDLCGVNSFMGTYWLAALRAAEEMALLADDGDSAERYRELFEAGSARYDELLFNGEYFAQVLDPDESPDFQWGAGCLSDQLIGQWWAHQLDLGHLLPREHVRDALRAVVRYNFRSGFHGFEHEYRIFADGDDEGLIVCTWPRGGRPDVPTRYADEVWTGVEYQVAAHCLQEGLVDEAMTLLRAMWARYDGSRRNPYNQIECGDHYVRNLAGWSVLEALTGLGWNAVTGELTLGPVDGQAAGWRVPFVAGPAWGTAELSTVDGSALTVRCVSGSLEVHRVRLTGVSWSTASVDGGDGDGGDGDVGCRVTESDGGTSVDLARPVTVAAGRTLTLRPV